MRGGASSPLASPVLVGAVTVLVTVVAVFLAYNANNGLPFVPTRALTVQLENGAGLVKGNEVRAGGYRVGVLRSVRPVQLPDGRVIAEADLKLDRTIGDIPVDSRVEIRPRSALGLKYIELAEGRSERAFEDGDTLPLRQTGIPTELDDVLRIFDEDTRDGARQNLKGFGNAFAARGPALNRAIGALPPFLTSLERVMHTLAEPETRLEDFFGELSDAARVVRPVAGVQARLFTDLADTFEAFSRDEQALKDTISKSPPTLAESTTSLRVQRPFLADFAEFSEDFAGATRELRGALPTLNEALAVGIPVTRRSVRLNENLRIAFVALRDLARDPATNAGLRALTATVTTLNPQLRFYGPFVTVCNYWNYFWTYVAEHFSERNPSGGAQRVLLNEASRQTNSIGSIGAYEPANGQDVREGNAQYLQGQVYTAAVGPDGRADCEAGQRGFLERNSRFAPDRLKVNTDPRSPGLSGPTFRGKPRVPRGQTFTHRPQTGPYKDLPPSEVQTRFGG